MSSKKIKANDFIYGIDVGIVQMGAMKRYMTPLPGPEFPYECLEVSNALVTKDGKYYKKFEENLSTEIAMNWLRDRWDVISKAKIVGVEPQLAYMFSLKNRQCLMLAHAMYAVLTAYHSMGKGPPVVWTHPKWVKNLVGITTTGEEKETVKTKQHRQNKLCSVQTFKERFPGNIPLTICPNGKEDDV
ncbi:MAG: hypothetical protein AABY22_11065, partial [Nanoarchaeota archaeon]